jgi:hypothetical protein
MKSALSLTLIICLVGSTTPLAAQGQFEAAPGPIARAVTLEAARFAFEASAAAALQQAAHSDWSRVGTLEPGTEVILTVQDSQPVKRYFLSADDSTLTVLTLADSVLPSAAARVLRGLASQHGGWLTGTERGEFVNGNVRVRSDGVFVADQKVADLAHLVERIARLQVAELRLASPGGHPVAKSVGIGAAIGLGVGLLVFGSKGCTRGCDDPGLGLLVGAMAGLPLGATGGLVLGLSRSHNDTRIVYRVP